jgi:hypothetical protein
MKNTGNGVTIDNELICILLYADDIVLIAANEADLQYMLNVLADWCSTNTMIVNPEKSNIVHFRPQSVGRSDCCFKCGDHFLKVVGQYTYLGLMLNEFLDFDLTAKSVAQSASRALGLLIAKAKQMGGMPYNVFNKLYDSTVWPVISYTASIWGTKSYTCINAVQNRAIRFFLGVGKYTPTAALYGETAWRPPHVKQWRSVSQQWHRLCTMDTNRLNYKIFMECRNKSNSRCKNWQFMYNAHMSSLDLDDFLMNCSNMSSKVFCSNVEEKTMNIYIASWKNSINNMSGPSRNGRNKLRSYRVFKQDYETEMYVSTSNIPAKHRSALAKFRCGVAPIRLETGRYENMPVNARLCPICKNAVETEKHVLLECSTYQTIRNSLYEEAVKINHEFHNWNDDQKFEFVLSNNNIVRESAKTCFSILNMRSNLLYS